MMAMADYLACFWPELTELAVLRESLAISLSAAKGEGGCRRRRRRRKRRGDCVAVNTLPLPPPHLSAAGTKDFTEHLSPQAIQEGLRKVSSGHVTVM